MASHATFRTHHTANKTEQPEREFDNSDGPDCRHRTEVVEENHTQFSFRLDKNEEERERPRGERKSSKVRTDTHAESKYRTANDGRSRFEDKGERNNRMDGNQKKMCL